MKGIITVIGKDHIGIIAKVCTYLAEKNLNILDINQTIVKDYFNMMMIVDIGGGSDIFAETAQELDALGKDNGLIIKLQHEDIFNTMHRI